MAVNEEINFVETNAEVLNDELLNAVQAYLGKILYPGDEKRLLLQAISYAFTDVLNHINTTGRSNLLRYATGASLDAIGELYGNSRLEAEHASTTIAFTISEMQNSGVIIPAGTRVTPDGLIFFATDADLIFEAETETLTKSISATATEAGKSYNGFAPGQINALVDTNPYIMSVTNTTVSEGGTDIETDDEYRERLQLSPFSFSVAGPANSYRAIALSVSNQIADAQAYSPVPGDVEIAIVLKDGVLPEADGEILTKVLEACSADDVRPLTDHVRVVPATAVTVAIDAKYYVANGDTTVAAAVLKAVDEYKTWQCEKIGRDINPDRLRDLMLAAGAAMITINSPVYHKVPDGSVAQISDTSVTYGGSISI